MYYSIIVIYSLHLSKNNVFLAFNTLSVRYAISADVANIIKNNNNRSGKINNYYGFIDRINL